MAYIVGYFLFILQARQWKKLFKNVETHCTQAVFNRWPGKLASIQPVAQELSQNNHFIMQLIQPLRLYSASI